MLASTGRRKYAVGNRVDADRLNMQHNVVRWVAIALPPDRGGAHAIEHAIVTERSIFAVSDKPGDMMRPGIEPQIDGGRIHRRYPHHIIADAVERLLADIVRARWKAVRQEIAEAADIGVAPLAGDRRRLAIPDDPAVRTDAPQRSAVEPDMAQLLRTDKGAVGAFQTAHRTPRFIPGTHPAGQFDLARFMPALHPLPIVATARRLSRSQQRLSARLRGFGGCWRMGARRKSKQHRSQCERMFHLANVCRCWPQRNCKLSHGD